MAGRNEVIAALRTRLMTVPGLYTVAWQNVSFTPTSGTPYIEESFVFGTADDAACGPGPRWREVRESYQLMICIPPDTHVGDLAEQAAAIEGVFLNGTSIVLDGGATVWIRDTVLGGPRLEAGWLKAPLVINYMFIYQT